MLMTEAFNLADLQNCLHLLNVAESAGVTDIRFVRQRLADDVRARALATRVSRVDERKGKPPAARAETCPECGSRSLVPTTVGAERVVTCKSCRWSRYIGAYGQPL